MLLTKGTRFQRVFWTAVASAWIAMLVGTIWTRAEYILVPGWGILLTILGMGMLIDHTNVVEAYRRGVPRGMSVAYVRGLVTASGLLLFLIGIVVSAVGFIRCWRA
jgi:hypothetical protein